MARRKKEPPSPAKPKTAKSIHQAMLGQIIRGDFVPGERLPGERELAQQYGANRTTLRAAIAKLEQSKLVTVRQGQGATVADFRSAAGIDLLPAFLEEGSDPAEKIHVLEDLLGGRLLL